MLIGDVLKQTKYKRATFDHYVRLGLIPFTEERENGYRDFSPEAVERGHLIRKLTKRPFRLGLKDIKKIFDNIPVNTLTTKNARTLHRYLLDKDLL
jgi:DNA-binding transcriptional MerR regulator